MGVAQDLAGVVGKIRSHPGAGMRDPYEGTAPVRVVGGAPFGTYAWLKRAMDLVISALLLALFAPFMLVIALLIELDSPGPAIFSQRRMGYDRGSHKPRPFTCHKFRSMRDKSDERVHEQHIRDCIRSDPSTALRSAQDAPSAGPAIGHASGLVKLACDQRVTRIGRFLRRYSLDELPQLWDVLVGEMSLVGPRPVPLYEIAQYEVWHRQRLEAVPGMTGWWQVRGRGRVTLNEMAAMDIQYIHSQSLWLDLKIIVLTLPAVIKGVGAG